MHRTLTVVVFGLAGIGLFLTTPTLRSREGDLKPARLQIQVAADAELTVDGVRTKQLGEVRHFISPPLATGQNFIYTFRATWKDGGKEISREKKVHVQAGSETTVDLRRADD